ncbi:DUF6443 domain-containing protein [Chitinophaga solisilvae]|uniref:DUF6443 domain-containing protein n=1 Tax=Chitinophaga solisilvae TaxID=1233460 RepID=UPI0019224509|nr:DUF6443 domain-containing protein [Chitinophaga solisilvae]
MGYPILYLKWIALIAIITLFHIESSGQNIPSKNTTVPVAVPAPMPSAPQNRLVNYVRTYEPFTPITDPMTIINAGDQEVKRSTIYIDGIGRTLQTVVKGGSGQYGRDIVSPIVYDSCGREQFKYLPYVQQTGNVNDGLFKSDPFNSQKAFYENNQLNPGIGEDKIFYSQVEYEPSPLNRVTKTYSQGNSWAKTGGNRPQTQLYQLNSPADSVRIWSISSGSNIPVSTGIYPTGVLQKNIAIDENGNQLVVFVNKDKQVILKKVQLNQTPGTAHMGWLCTYYVYDDFDKLRFVIPPLATEKITSSWDPSKVANGLCYIYKYDERRRQIMRKIPGADSTEFVYDTRDRLVFTKDGNLRSKGQWMFNGYDNQNRLVMTALYTNAAASRSLLQSGMDAASGYQELSYAFPGINDLVLASHNGSSLYQAKSSVTMENGFDSGLDADFLADINPNLDYGTTNIKVNNSLPQINNADLTPLSYIFYDSYNFTGAVQPLTGDFNKFSISSDQHPVAISGVSAMTRGLATGSKVRIINTDQWQTTTIYYNDQGQKIQSIKDNVSGGRDIVTTIYNFNGQPLAHYLRHRNQKSIIPEVTRLQTLTYDAASRLSSVKDRLNDNAAAEKVISLMEYDELGQLKAKRLGGIGAQQLERITYDYNVRGLLKTIGRNYLNNIDDSSHFGQEYNYDFGFQENQYNNNVAGIRWKGWNDKTSRAYGYQYDNSSRMTAANFSQQNTTGGNWLKDVKDFSVEGVSYDANGNILSMRQNGLVDNQISSIDRLKYTYEAFSNRLLAVKDTSTVPNLLGDFKDGNTSGDDYAYDSSGNIIKDLNRKISDIRYNYLGLPERITFANQSLIQYQYDANGTKIRKIVTDKSVTPAVSTMTDYIDGFIYRNDSLQIISHQEGRIRALYKVNAPVSFAYDFFVKDLLNNTRLILTDNKESLFYRASMETAVAAKENALFSNIESTRVPKPVGFPNDGNTDKNEFVAKLVAKEGGKKIGPSIVLRVMAGDTIQIGAKAFYKSSGPQEKKSGFPAENLLPDLIQAFGGNFPSDQTHGGNALNQQTPFNASFYNNDYQRLKEKEPGQYQSDKPRAYLNYVLFDDQFKLVDENSGVKQVKGEPEQLQVLTQDRMAIKKSGFLYVYTSNESPQDVYFDDVVVMDIPGPVLEETHYYPFGLTMEGISYSALRGPGYQPNNFKFTGKEMQKNEFSDGTGLEMYDFGARFYDPQIGRWHTPDPLSETSRRWSPYAYVYNNPMKFTDPDGMAAHPVSESGSNNPEFDPGKYKDEIKVKVEIDPYTGELTFSISGPWLGDEKNSKGGNKTQLQTQTQNQSQTNNAFVGLLPIAAEGAAYLYGVMASSTFYSFPTSDAWAAGVSDLKSKFVFVEGGGKAVYYAKQLYNKIAGLPVFAAAPVKAISRTEPTTQLPYSVPFVGHANKKSNTNPHLVYTFTYNPPAGFSPTLKYGIASMYPGTFDFDRPELQVAAFRALYGASVNWRALVFTPNRETALDVERNAVNVHIDVWGYRPIEQKRP